ncbi:hypothetical protein FRC02_001115 [Tulasnella sp. 418]|nr:hypothetical protein FRC02_001115 [Tulasnella sp. 418]
MLTRHIMAKPVKRMENASSSRLEDCPRGFTLRLVLKTTKFINHEWSTYYPQLDATRGWEKHVVMPKDIKLLSKSGGACLYSFQHPDHDVSLAIGELFINDENTHDKRYEELQQLNALLGDSLQRKFLHGPNQRTVTPKGLYQFIIRKTFTSFCDTVGFREAFTKDEHAKHTFTTDASEVIAQLVKNLYDQHNLVWNVQDRTLSLRDSHSKFKFFLDYPEDLGRYKPIIANPGAWEDNKRFKTQEESKHIYDATKNAMEMEIESEFRVSDSESDHEDHCPQGFVLRLGKNIFKAIDAEWAAYFTSVTNDWKTQGNRASIHPEHIKSLGKSGDACLYGFLHNGQPVAIGELFIGDGNDCIRRTHELQVQQPLAIYDAFHMTDLKDLNGKRTSWGRKHCWIIRKSFAGFRDTVGFREAITQNDLTRGNAMFSLSLLVSDDIARRVQGLYNNHQIIWKARDRAVGLGDFLFYTDYPKERERYTPFIISRNTWGKADDEIGPSETKALRSIQVYEETKKAIQIELGIYSDETHKKTPDELEEEMFSDL